MYKDITCSIVESWKCPKWWKIVGKIYWQSYNYHQAPWIPEWRSLHFPVLASYHLDHKNIQGRGRLVTIFTKRHHQTSHLTNRTLTAGIVSEEPTHRATERHHGFSFHGTGVAALNCPHLAQQQSDFTPFLSQFYYFAKCLVSTGNFSLLGQVPEAKLMLPMCLKS